MPTPAETMRTYILAKDGNRPFLMKQAFAVDAELETVVKKALLHTIRSCPWLAAWC